ncbi:class III poly(R)-hydroxyalkanoic acid synthase subunit PhaC [Aliamphritea spongicola]|uniref:class III poly(R)-hydroxyalkanoic acid synthase subunit PhaC n=1 Tax=Aliamphritea spongicola TaxID=707589 RepID=UPI00196B37B3|nr:class III poly(R)-hydroxyalkanoic acid synthase subunit PhaC [Aliamphritea spongicola]MBN3560650.1 class III poly(R)-hydroxyalkanoic acid synthase subunit PhaC [Aliamphritea spongicola]
MSDKPFTLRQIAAEISQFNQQLADSYRTLQSLTDCEVGPTPKDCIYKEDKLRLYKYRSQVADSCQTPLLICYALVNRPYMLDLDEQRSFIARLTASGIPVYLIDWGYPDAADCFLDMDDYINGYLHNCVEQVKQHSGQPRINLLGICQGGCLSLSYTALQPDNIKNLITMVTPVDFHTPGNMLSHLIQQTDVDLMVDTLGNIPGQMLNDAYAALMPMRLSLQKYLNMPAQCATEEQAAGFLRMEKWINDSPDQAGEMFREFVTQFFKGNGFIQDSVRVGDRQVNLQQIQQPILNVYGSYDHLVPPAASKALKDLTASSDYRELEIKSGHIGVFVSQKSRKTLAPAISQWLTDRDH